LQFPAFPEIGLNLGERFDLREDFALPARVDRLRHRHQRDHRQPLGLRRALRLERVEAIGGGVLRPSRQGPGGRQLPPPLPPRRPPRAAVRPPPTPLPPPAGGVPPFLQPHPPPQTTKR